MMKELAKQKIEDFKGSSQQNRERTQFPISVRGRSNSSKGIIRLYVLNGITENKQNVTDGLKIQDGLG